VNAFQKGLQFTGKRCSLLSAPASQYTINCALRNAKDSVLAAHLCCDGVNPNFTTPASFSNRLIIVYRLNLNSSANIHGEAEADRF